MFKNKIISFSFISVLLLLFIFAVPASASPLTVTTPTLGVSSTDAAPQEIKLTIDHDLISFDVPPTIINGRTLVPLRKIFETLGAEVEWHSNTKTVKGFKGDKWVILQINNKSALINGKDYELDVPATILQGRTLVPARVIAESLGAKVSWDKASRTVIILTQDVITFEDPNFEAVIRKTIDKPKEDIYSSDVKKIQSLDASTKDISSIEGIQYLEKLTALYLDDNQIEDLTPLKHLENLQFLSASENQFKNIDALSNLTNLDFLTLSENNISDLSPLENLTKLQFLYLNSCSLTDITSLSKLASLEHLHLWGNNLQDLGGLESLHNLVMLDLDMNQIHDLQPLSDLDHLESLKLSENMIQDLTPLKDLSNLSYLDVSFNQITDIEALGHLNSLRSLNIYYNSVIDLRPLKNLEKLKSLRIEDYSIATDINDELFAKYEAMLDRANEIIDAAIKPGMSDYEKELALHDALVNQTAYDYENYLKDTVPDESHHPYGVLTKRVAVCDGYAQTMQALCHMVGVECLVVLGDSYSDGEWGGHAWNMVRIDGQYYQVDPTFNDPTSDNIENQYLTHNYFNISDRQLAANHRWDRDLYPSCNIDNEDFNRTMELDNAMAITDDAIYRIEYNKLVKIDIKDGSRTDLTTNDPREMVLYDGWIYYTCAGDEPAVYKIRLDGTEETSLVHEDVRMLAVEDTGIYYIDEENILSKTDLNGKNKIKLTSDGMVSTTVNIVDGWTYFKSFDWRSEKAKLYRTQPGRLSHIAVTGELNGFDTETEPGYVTFYYVHEEFIVDGWVYYLNKQADSTLYKVKLDGSDNTKLNWDSSEWIEIVGDWIYYINNESNNDYYRIKTDGTQRERVH